MEISALQMEQVNDRIRALEKSGSFYGKKLEEAGIHEVHSPEEFKKLPFSEKKDLRDAYPLGLTTAPEEKIVRIHSSSGTTGKPVIIPYTQKDVDDWAIQFARCYAMAGVTDTDRVQITPGYGLWTAGIGFQAGCERLGAMAIPMGPGNTDKQLEMMQSLHSTVICATSSYALLLAEEIAKRGIRDKISLKKGIIGSERWSAKMRDKIATSLGIELYDIYGLTEIYGPGIGISCKYDTGMHKISIICRLSKFDALKKALNEVGVTGMTMTQVMGCGIQKGTTEKYRGVPVDATLLPKVKVEVIVGKIPVDNVIETAKKALYTGHIGDGKIFVYNVTRVVKVRTGEEDRAALADVE